MKPDFGAPIATNGPLFSPREFREYRPPATQYRNYEPRSGFVTMTTKREAPSRQLPPSAGLSHATLVQGSARAAAAAAARTADPASPPSKVIRLLRLAKEPLTAREIHDATGIPIKSIGPLISRINASSLGSISSNKQPGSNYRLYQWIGEQA